MNAERALDQNDHCWLQYDNGFHTIGYNSSYVSAPPQTATFGHFFGDCSAARVEVVIFWVTEVDTVLAHLKRLPGLKSVVIVWGGLCTGEKLDAAEQKVRRALPGVAVDIDIGTMG
jgi:hypothetical protein